MQIAQRSSVAARAARPSRSAVVVRASAESSRRAVLGGILAVAALSGAKEALAVATPVDFQDDRKAKATGFDLIYEARDLDLPQAVRDGLTQARSSLAETKARIKASESRVDSLIEKSVSKNYWTEAREELRLQVGTLRFDLNTLASSKPTKAEKKKAQELKNTFIAKVEALDLALRKKDEKSAAAALDAVKSSLDAVLAFVL